MININCEELAWAAGLFDGEGNIKTVQVYKSKHVPGHGFRRPALSVAQSDIQVLERFQKAILNLGKIYGPYKYKTQTKPYWLFQVNSFEEVQATVGMLWVFLSPIKREQSRKVLQDMQIYHQLPALKKGPRGPWKNK